MRLCVINNIIMLLIIIVLGKISYNILRNKKNYETFTNGWSLNHDGKLCYESTCEDIAVLGSGDSGKICTISGNTLECDKIEESADDAEGVEDESVAVDGDDDNEDDPSCSDSASVSGSLTITADGIVSTTKEIDGYQIYNIDNVDVLDKTDDTISFLSSSGLGVAFGGAEYIGQVFQITSGTSKAKINFKDTSFQEIEISKDSNGCYSFA